MADTTITRIGPNGIAVPEKMHDNGDGTYSSQVYSGGGTVPLQTTTTNRSGSITAGGTSQTLAAANAARRYLLIQNPTSAAESFWVRLDGSAAVANSPSIEVAPGVTLMFEGTFIPTGAITVIAATTGTKFTAVEG